MQLFLKIFSGMANSIDLDQTVPFLSPPFVRNFGVGNFRTFTIL